MDDMDTQRLFRNRLICFNLSLFIELSNLIMTRFLLFLRLAFLSVALTHGEFIFNCRQSNNKIWKS